MCGMQAVLCSKVSPFSWIWRRKTGWCPCFMPQSDIVGHFRTLWGHCWRNNVVTDTLWKRQYSRLARLLTSWPHVSLNCHATIPSLQSLACFVTWKGFGWCSQAILSPHSIQSDIWPEKNQTGKQAELKLDHMAAPPMCRWNALRLPFNPSVSHSFTSKQPASSSPSIFGEA